MWFKHTNRTTLSFSQRVLHLVLFLALAAGLGGALPLQAAAAPQLVSTTLVISQIQVAGGSASDEFVELHNISGSSYDLNGHRLVYRSGAGTSDVGVTTWDTSTIIPAGGYYLVAHMNYDDSTAGDRTWGTVASSGSFSGATGGIALRNGAANSGTVIDSVGYGTATNAFVETAVTAVPAANASGARLNAGCTDTDNNSLDFETLNPSAPRSSATAAAICSSDPTPPSGIGAATPNPVLPTQASLLTVSVTPGANPISTGLSATVNLSAIGGSATQTLYDDASNGDAAGGDNIFSFSYTIPVGTATGPYTLTADLLDDQARSATVDISLVITDTDAAPQVLSVSPELDATGVALNANLSVTFSEPVDVTAPWISLSCASSGSHTVAISGGPSSYTINPDSDFVADELCTATISAANIEDVDSFDPPGNLAADYVWSFTAVSANVCPGSFTAINAIQGSGSTSPLSGSVTTQGIVVADFQATGQMNGYYIQSVTPDADPATSEGIMIYNTSSAVALGDIVQVTGSVSEYLNQTELINITATTICSSGNSLPAPVTVNMPEVANGDLERYEGMLVHIPQTLYVTQNFFLGRYGQTTLAVANSESNLLYYPSNGNYASATLDENSRRILILDDANSSQNPNPIPYLDSTTHTQRAGDSVAGLTGILDEGAINSNTALRDYRLQPTIAPVFTHLASRTAAPQSVGAGANVKVAAFNVLNYFNGDGAGGGFPTSRGADTLDEFNRQRTKIIAALQAIDADVVGLMEIENDGTDATSALQDLVNGLNDAMGANTYALISEPAPGSDAIKTSLIYKPAVVTPQGAALNYQTDFGGYTDVFDRPPLIQTFKLNSNDEVFSAVMNHFKSRRCDGATGDDLDAGFGCYDAKRTAQAQALSAYIDTFTANLGDTDILVLGDLNAYSQETPVLAFADPSADVPLVNVTAYNDRIPAADRYTYVFDGWLGELDHALASESLNAQITGATIWHINATEPSVLDYNTEFKPQDFYAPTPYRSSDHDPVIVGLNLGGEVLTAPNGALTAADTLPGGGLKLTWTMDALTNLSGFNVYRSDTLGGTRTQLNTQLLPVTVAMDYDFTDLTAVPGQNYFYWVELVLTDDSTHMLSPLQAAAKYLNYFPVIHLTR